MSTRESIIPRLQHEVALAVLAGHDPHEINETIIDPEPALDEEHKAALFLYAWSMQEPGIARQRSRQYLDDLVDAAG
jgi:hypothetical protein